MLPSVHALTIIVALATILASTFTGISLLYLARSTRAATSQAQVQIEQTQAVLLQTEYLNKQTELLNQQAQAHAVQSHHFFAATELTFNLDVMMQLDRVLTDVAVDPELHAHIWTNREEGTRAQVAGDAILDVATMALKACERLPGFQTNVDDWSSFGTYLMESSDALRTRVLDNRDWWPELAPYALKVHGETTEGATRGQVSTT
jgi:hypothetical protein